MGPLLATFATLFALPSTRALLNIDGTRNQVYVFGSASYAFDTNIFSDSSERGDYTTSASVGVELKRKRGIISIDATATFDYLGFQKYTDQSSWNPSFSTEFNKSSGRTTGAFTIRAYRTNRADSAVNLRTSSWNFPLGLNIKYPVNDRLYLSSNTGYMSRKYADNQTLVDYTDYSQGLDVFYTYNSKVDLVGGYRIRVSHAGLQGSTYDHSATFGVTGGLLPKVNGTLRGGYQIRQLTVGNESYAQFTLSASLGWIPTRKFNTSLQISRDFTTTAIGGTVDSLSLSSSSSYYFTRKLELSAGVGGGRNRFLSKSAPARADWFISWDASFHYSYNEHLRIGGAYTYMKNWSTFSYSDFERSSYSFDISSRF